MWFDIEHIKTIHSISLVFGTFSAVKIEVWGQYDADFESYITMIKMGETSLSLIT